MFKTNCPIDRPKHNRALGVLIFMFEAVLIAGLQAFIFAILTAIYLGGAVSRH